MPLYTVAHSYPLSGQQKQELATAITKLHTAKFLAPSFFVHVNFQASDASNQNYFVAGKSRISSTNRIIGIVRVGSSRTKKDWDELAAQIEDAWYTVVSGAVLEEGKHQGKRENAVDDNASTTEAKELLAVAFQGLVAAWEHGGPLPAAGEEAAWLKENREHFQGKADLGDELYKDLLEEVDNREELKKAYGT